MLERHVDLEQKNTQMLARHRQMQDGIEDVKNAAARAGVRGVESKFINVLAEQISALKVEREKGSCYSDEKMLRSLSAKRHRRICAGCERITCTSERSRRNSSFCLDKLKCS